MTNLSSHDNPDPTIQSYEVPRAPEEHMLVEHSDSGDAQFSRLGTATFSAEDRVTLKHVAGVLGMLAAIALTAAIVLVVT